MSFRLLLLAGLLMAGSSRLWAAGWDLDSMEPGQLLDAASQLWNEGRRAEAAAIYLHGIENWSAEGQGQQQLRACKGLFALTYLVDQHEESEELFAPCPASFLDQYFRATDREAVPVLKYAPEYPEGARRDGTEGSVLVQFDVSRSGKPVKIRVIESSNEVFERPAIAAAGRFVYLPRVRNGRAVRATGIRNTITFKLAEPDERDGVSTD